MLILDQFPEIRELTMEQRMKLAAEIWDEIEADPAYQLVLEAQIAELQQQTRDYESGKESGKSWEEVKANLQASRKNAA